MMQGNGESRFCAAAGVAANWQQAADAVAARLLAEGAGGTLGFLYTGEAFAGSLGEIADFLRMRTGVGDWVAASGYGIVAPGIEQYGAPAMAAMVTDLPANGYRLFAGGETVGQTVRVGHADWLEAAVMPLAVTHVDPTNRGAVRAIADLTMETGSFLVGGLTAAAAGPAHEAGGASGGLSGVMISPLASEVATALTQGCSPIGEPHRVTRAEANVLIELDGKPALEVFKADIGEVLARDLHRVAGHIFAALPVAGSDQRDYTVRNLTGIDPASGAIAIAERVRPGDQVLFCRRDRETAIADMRRMLGDLKRRIGGRPIRGGLYISCAARGPNQFERPDREIDLIARDLGQFPFIGFFANGELSRDRLYAYTGVLTLFL